MVEKINPNAPVVKAIATILLKLAIIFSGLFAKVIPLTSRIIQDCVNLINILNDCFLFLLNVLQFSQYVKKEIVY